MLSNIIGASCHSSAIWVVAEGAYGAGFGYSGVDIGPSHTIAALRHVVDHRVGEENDIVDALPAFVDILVDRSVCAEKPLAFGIVCIEHVAGEHVGLPLEVDGVVRPCLCGIERHGVETYMLCRGIEIVLHEFVGRVYGEEVVARRHRGRKDSGKRCFLYEFFH